MCWVCVTARRQQQEDFAQKMADKQEAAKAEAERAESVFFGEE
jgi:hypothetical protein